MDNFGSSLYKIRQLPQASQIWNQAKSNMCKPKLNLLKSVKLQPKFL